MKNLIILLLFTLNLCGACASKETTSFLIIKAATHPALDATERGIRDTLVKEGIKSTDIKTTDMQGKSSNAATSINKAIKQGQTLIVFTIGTTPSQTASSIARNKDNVRVIFASVTDPLESGLVQNLNRPPSYITGVSNMYDIAPQIALFKKVQPGLKTLGYLYNPGESNSITLMKKIDEECKKQGLNFVAQTAQNTNIMPTSARLLAQKADAIFVSNDNTALSCIPTISKAGLALRKPLYVSDTDVVSSGAALASGPDQYDIGIQAAEMALQNLQGTPLCAIPVAFPRQGCVCINTKVITLLGLAIPEDVVKDAQLVC